MIRYLKQGKYRTGCVPITMVNALKFQGRPSAKRGHQLVRYFRRKFNYQRGGVVDADAVEVYMKFGFRQMNDPNWRRVAKSLFDGNALIVAIRYCSAEKQTTPAPKVRIVERYLSGHTFLLDGVAVHEGIVRYHAINDARHHRKGVAVNEFLWLTASEIMETYSRIEAAKIDYIYIVPRHAIKETA